MFRIPYQTFVLLSLLFLLVGCTNTAKPLTQTTTQDIKQATTDYDGAIMDLASSIFDVNQLYLNKLINIQSQLSDESVKSIKGLIDVGTKKAAKNYAKLSGLKGNKQNQIDVLKHGLDKLQSMNIGLEKYKDNAENKSKLISDYQIVNNYWETYYELNKK